jgi:hypothetical protein
VVELLINQRRPGRRAAGALDDDPQSAAFSARVIDKIPADRLANT